ncbi:glutathione S-transferase [Vibrio cortegadensis]|nr:glutathione S-transferase [Vibrio cortegadensis]MDN3696916.1 glutathione S-transferase [Vibrio cortegadensis]
MPLPILYSLRRCPYAMRARMGLLLAEQSVLIRDIVTRNKPAELLKASPKGTVPVLVLNNGDIVDQSLDIMIWALTNNDPMNLLRRPRREATQAPEACLQKSLSQSLYPSQDQSEEMMELVTYNDSIFIIQLEQYRASVRYHDSNQAQYRQPCLTFIDKLEQRLSSHQFLCGETSCLADYALFPFISQFSRADRKWFVEAGYLNIQRWLTNHYQSQLYTKTMVQYSQWVESRKEFLLN